MFIISDIFFICNTPEKFIFIFLCYNFKCQIVLYYEREFSDFYNKIKTKGRSINKIMDYEPEVNNSNNYIVEKYSDLVYKICMTKLYNFNKSYIADACQNVFLNYLKSKPKFKDENHEKAWFIRCAINSCADIYRKLKYNSSYEEDIDNIDIPQISYELDDEINDSLGSLYEILSLLPEKIKYAVYLFYIEEYKTEEIAKILKTSSAAVRMRLKRGREILKKKLSKKVIIEIEDKIEEEITNV